MPQSGRRAPALVLHPPLGLAPTWRRKKSPRNEKCATLKVEQLVYATVAAMFHSLVPCRKKQPWAACLFAHFLSLSRSVSCTHVPKFVAYIAAFIARKVNGLKPVSTKWRLSDSFSYFPNFRFPLLLASFKLWIIPFSLVFYARPLSTLVFPTICRHRYWCFPLSCGTQNKKMKTKQKRKEQQNFSAFRILS